MLTPRTLVCLAGVVAVAAVAASITPAPRGTTLLATSASSEPLPTVAIAANPAITPAQESELVGHLERALFQQLSPRHQEMIANGFSRKARLGLSAACFAPDTPTDVIEAFRSGVPGFGQRFNAATRWGPTALDVDGGNPGEPTTITWSFVPDGTILPNEYGEGDLPSELFTWMNSIYGNFNTWKPQFDSIFNRWSEVSGLVFVYEPNDDGAAFPTTPGQAGVRGDVRVSAKNIDGNSGILAYNYFPDFGDMVINSFDSFYSDTNNNSIRLRNVLQHEVGHGIGFAHVCPIQNNKLMEPFVSVAYDGVRHDDIRAAQFNYGDRFEPNNTVAAATNIGALSASVITVGSVPAPAVANASSVGLASASDVDWYSFTTSASGVVTIDLQHIGFLYDDGSQNGNNCPFSGSCCFNDFTDSGLVPVSVELTTSSGTVLQSVLDITEGSATLRRQLGAGSYRLRVFNGSGTEGTQLYQLRVSSAASPLIVEHTPAALLAPSSATITASVRAGSQGLNNNNVRLFYRSAPGPFTQVAMTVVPNTSNLRANLPATPCPGGFEYYIQATGSGGGVVTLPSDAPTSFFSTLVGSPTTIFSDNFETNQGWTTGPDTAPVGLWQRVEPIGTFAAPAADTTADGTFCWVTQQSGAFGEAAGTNDVDGGLVRLVSPAINLQGRTGIRVSYKRWYSNVAGGQAGQDAFRAQVSVNNGSTWTDAQVIGPGTPDTIELQAGWRDATWLFPASLTPSAQTRVRFVAEDAGPGTVVEAGIDDFVITALGCGPTCDDIDVNNDGGLFDPVDIDAFLSVFSEGPCIPANAICQDIDFNNDGSLFDPCDIDSFLLVFSEGPCTPCGQ